MSNSNVSNADPDAIPVVDISPLLNGEKPESVARQLHAASQNLGFIYVKGHGIPANAIDAARDAAYQFFHAANTDKASITVSAGHRGWLQQGAAKMQDDAKADLKESFIWGYQDVDGNTPADHELRGPNQWPAFVPGLEPAAMDYFRYAHEVAFQLLRGCAISLGLAENFFVQRCAQPLSRASFVYYPSQPADCDSQQFGVGPHTDFGVLTVLCQDDVGGLEVEDINGNWIHAPPIEGTLVINVGDLLARWTDGAYKSTPHRVVNRSGRERLSLVLAFDPDPDTPIDARDIYGPDYVQKQDPTTCGDYLIWRFGKAFAYRNEKQKEL